MPWGPDSVAALTEAEATLARAFAFTGYRITARPTHRRGRSRSPRVPGGVGRLPEGSAEARRAPVTRRGTPRRHPRRLTASPPGPRPVSFARIGWVLTAGRGEPPGPGVLDLVVLDVDVWDLMDSEESIGFDGNDGCFAQLDASLVTCPRRATVRAARRRSGRLMFAPRTQSGEAPVVVEDLEHSTERDMDHVYRNDAGTGVEASLVGEGQNVLGRVRIRHVGDATTWLALRDRSGHGAEGPEWIIAGGGRFTDRSGAGIPVRPGRTASVRPSRERGHHSSLRARDLQPAAIRA